MLEAPELVVGGAGGREQYDGTSDAVAAGSVERIVERAVERAAKLVGYRIVQSRGQGRRRRAATAGRAKAREGWPQPVDAALPRLAGVGPRDPVTRRSGLGRGTRTRQTR